MEHIWNILAACQLETAAFGKWMERLPLAFGTLVLFPALPCLYGEVCDGRRDDDPPTSSCRMRKSIC